MVPITMLAAIILFNIFVVDGYVINPGPTYIATKGSVWPKPQVQTIADDYFIVTPRSFKFVLHSNSSNCVLLQNAFRRYSKIMQQNTMPRTNININKLNAIWSNTVLPEGKYLGFLRKLNVHLAGPCNDNDYPYLEMVESYDLTVNSSEPLLKSTSIWGILRGLETFSQLLYLGPRCLTVRMNSTVIQDYPRFPHRGLLLDTSRHFAPMGDIRIILDAMAFNKMNVFHWHLVDDHSFPFVSQRFPELSEKGAYHPLLFVYTPDDVQEVIEYARQRGIRVMPEFDTPGHTRSWGLSHPELLTDCSTIRAGAYGPVDPTKNTSYAFMETLLEEVKEVFKDKFVHLGGDEVGFECWNSDPNIVRFMADHNISTYERLQEYYILRIIDMASKLNLSSIVWEEIFFNGGDLSDNTLVHVWRNESGYYWPETLLKVTKAGKKSIVSGCWYLDYIARGGDWTKFYDCEPTEFGGSHEDVKYLMGGEACMWSEFVNEYSVIQRIWPRASAVAEKLWSAYVNMTNFDYKHTKERMEEHGCRMNRRGIPSSAPNAPGFCL